jgi:hypothetical protein
VTEQLRPGISGLVAGTLPAKTLILPCSTSKERGGQSSMEEEVKRLERTQGVVWRVYRGQASVMWKS